MRVRLRWNIIWGGEGEEENKYKLVEPKKMFVYEPVVSGKLQGAEVMKVIELKFLQSVSLCCHIGFFFTKVFLFDSSCKA